MGFNLLCEAGKTGQLVAMIVIVVVLIAALIVLPIFTNKKRQKQVQELHNSIAVGDTVKTVGGIVGKIVAIRDVNAVDKEFVLETGIEGSKATMVFDFNAIYQVMSKGSAPAAPAAEAPAKDEAVEVAAEEKPAEAPAAEESEEKAEESDKSEEK